MADRSTIALLKIDGTVDSVYTHWNGFISGNGAILYQYYNSIELIEELIKLGDIFQLTTILEPNNKTIHTLQKPQLGVSVFYARDGKEPLIIKQYQNLESYINSDELQGYNYIFYEKQNQWFCINRKTKKIDQLTKHLMQDEEVSEHIKDIIKKEKLKNKLEKKLKPKNTQSTIKINKI